MRLPSPARPPGACHRAAILASVATVVLAPGCGGGSGGGSTPAAPPADHAPAPPAGLLPPNADAALARIVGGTGGRLGLAVAPLGGGPIEQAGDLETGTAWSTMKVPLVVALVRSAGGWDALSVEERTEARLALTRSDNEAALALFDRLQELEGGLVPASDAIEEVLRHSGDAETHVNAEPNDEGFSTFGQTPWSTEASATFVRALAAGCLLGETDTREVTSLMEEVVADQRWGLGEAGYPTGTRLAFKGGWGPQPGGGYLVRQIGVLSGSDDGLVISVIATSPGSDSAAFAAGREMVTQAARWLERAIGTAPAGRPPECAG